MKSVEGFIVARDRAYFTMAFFSGDQPGDLSLVQVPGILHFPNDDGLLFNHVWGKTLRSGDQNVFGIRRNLIECPSIGQYIDVAQQMHVDLIRGYLFRPATPNGGMIHLCRQLQRLD